MINKTDMHPLGKIDLIVCFSYFYDGTLIIHLYGNIQIPSKPAGLVHRCAEFQCAATAE